MLFAIGTRVRFRYTGDRGVITSKLEDGMLQVRLDNDPALEIPAFEEDLIRDDSAEPVSAGAKFIQGKKEKEPEAPPRRSINVQYHILKPKGIQLAFEPMPGRDGIVTRYKVWLVNDTSHEFLIEFDLFTADRDILIIDDKLAATTALELGDLLYDDLSTHPEVFVRVRRLTTAGPDEPIEKGLKIKPKTFFNNLHTVPILNLLAHHFLLLDNFEPGTASSSSEDLKSYTKSHARKPRGQGPGNSTPYKAHNVEEYASFVPEIDLHIENLMNGYTRIDKGEILRIQLQHLQRFMEKAIRLGTHRVYVIHGVGEGKLKESVHQHLRGIPEVVKFKNEYHHRYGYGATEVILE